MKEVGSTAKVDIFNVDFFRQITTALMLWIAMKIKLSLNICTFFTILLGLVFCLELELHSPKVANLQVLPKT